ncbi:MAG: helicase-related protein [Dehalococcoidia bacterium]
MQATSTKQSLAFSLGETVIRQGFPHEPGAIVDGPRAGSSGHSYQIFFSANQIVWVPAADLQRPPPPTYGMGHRRFLRDIAVQKLSHRFTDVLYSIGASRTRFLVYQFQPVLKFIQTLPHGMLIADEVGLGKTIEAGLILKELLARGSIKRVLVVCPANLRQKWESEMKLRFGLQFRQIEAKDIRAIRRDVELGSWPEFFGIASLEGLRRDELQDVLTETGIHFDLVVVDEAHHLRNRSTASYGLGEVLSEQSEHLLLLSATPVQTGRDDLLSLLRLIEPSQFERTSIDTLDAILEPNRYINQALAALARQPCDGRAVAADLREVLTTDMASAFRDNQLFLSCIARLETEPLTAAAAAELTRDLQRVHTLAPYYTRTRKREVEDAARRRSQVVHVPLSPEEQAFYDAWVGYLRAVAAVRSGGAPSTWAVSMRERQAASSLIAARNALPALLADEPVSSDVESSDPDPASSRGPVSFTPFPLATSVLAQRRVEVQSAARSLGVRDSKGERFLQIVRDLVAGRPDRKVLVFTFFKGTLRHLAEMLRAADIAVYKISGDDRPEDRARIVKRFEDDPAARVLLSTEVGSEGLDFQFCDTVVNYDLPWNPMRVEQRIGRIDRFGQPAPVVTVISLFTDETIDTRILDRLYGRIRVFEESIGELEPILGPVVQDLQTQVLDGRLSEEEERRKVDEALTRIERLRLSYQDLEASRAELFGQGDLIRQQIDSARESGRYVSAAELEALVSCWLKESPLGADSIQPRSGHRGFFELHLSPDTIGRIYDWMRREGRSDPQVGKLLQKLQDRAVVWVTFDSERAQQREGASFIDVAHPIVRVALEDARRQPLSSSEERVATLCLPARSGWPPSAAFFLYRLEVSGAERQVTMLPVAIDPRVGEVLPTVGEQLLGQLVHAVSETIATEPVYEGIRLIQDVAFCYADDCRVEAVQLAAAAQQARLAARRAALDRHFEIRLDRKRAMLERATDARIRRMHEGEIRSLTAEYQSKCRELDEMPEPLGSIECIAIAWFRFDSGS